MSHSPCASVVARTGRQHPYQQPPLHVVKQSFHCQTKCHNHSLHACMRKHRTGLSHSGGHREQTGTNKKWNKMPALSPPTSLLPFRSFFFLLSLLSLLSLFFSSPSSSSWSSSSSYPLLPLPVPVVYVHAAAPGGCTSSATTMPNNVYVAVMVFGDQPDVVSVLFFLSVFVTLSPQEHQHPCKGDYVERGSGGWRQKRKMQEIRNTNFVSQLTD